MLKNCSFMPQPHCDDLSVISFVYSQKPQSHVRISYEIALFMTNIYHLHYNTIKREARQKLQNFFTLSQLSL